MEKIVDEKSRGRIGESRWREMSIREKTDNLIGMLKEATRELKEEPRKERKVMFSKETEEVLEKRAIAIQRGEEEEYNRLTKVQKKSKGKTRERG